MATIRPPRWYDDPTGRHTLRYWDGQQWSAMVIDREEVGGQGASGMSQPADWYPDPARRGAYRYFDGLRWTTTSCSTTRWAWLPRVRRRTGRRRSRTSPIHGGSSSGVVTISSSRATRVAALVRGSRTARIAELQGVPGRRSGGDATWAPAPRPVPVAVPARSPRPRRFPRRFRACARDCAVASGPGGVDGAHPGHDPVRPRSARPCVPRGTPALRRAVRVRGLCLRRGEPQPSPGRRGVDPLALFGSARFLRTAARPWSRWCSRDSAVRSSPSS